MSDPSPLQHDFSGSVKDARGRTVPRLDPYSLWLRRRHDVIGAEALASIARKVGSGWAIQGQLIFTAIWSVTIILLIIAHVAKWGGGLSIHPRELRLWSVLAVIFLVNITIVWFVSRWVRGRRVRQIMLEHGRCPHCGYDLHNLPAAAEDGATVCPECGCAWTIENRTSSRGGV